MYIATYKDGNHEMIKGLDVLHSRLIEKFRGVRSPINNLVKISHITTEGTLSAMEINYFDSERIDLKPIKLQRAYKYGNLTDMKPSIEEVVSDFRNDLLNEFMDVKGNIFTNTENVSISADVELLDDKTGTKVLIRLDKGELLQLRVDKV